MIIKVCGMRDAENIRAVENLGADIIGLVFYPDSPRYVSMVSSGAGILPDFSNFSAEAAHTRKANRLGVFLNDMPQNIVTRVYNYGLDFVQLHGEESPVMIENLRRTLDPDIRPGIQIIKSLCVSTADDLEKTKPYEGVADMFQFNMSPEVTDWSMLDAYEGATPFLLSGIGPEDVTRVRAFHHPCFVGLNLNARFETEPGIMDVERLKTFIHALSDDAGAACS